MSQDEKQSEGKRTVVEEGTRFKGDLMSTCPVDVRGRVEGEVEAPSLTVSAAGAVHGRAKVGSVYSEGELSGEFEAETIELSGTVKDQTVIRARSLQVRLASTRGQQVIFGDCELSVGDEPTEHDVVEEPAEEAAPVEAEVAAAAEPEMPAPMTEVAAEPGETLQTEQAEQENTVDATAAEPVMAVSGEQAEAGEANTESSDQASEASDSIDADDIVEETAEAHDEQAASSLEEALTSEVAATEGKGKKGRGKRKNNGARANTETATGWSSPPSQPPPGE